MCCANSEYGTIEKLRSVHFEYTPESLTFTMGPYHTPSGEEDKEEELELIIGLRGVAHLVYHAVRSGREAMISMNENAWDTHCSFTPLYLSVSPDRRYLLIATDKAMHLVLRLRSHHRVRVLAGHNAGDYSKPVVVWDATGQYVYSNSEEEAALYVFSLCSQRVTQKLVGHAGILRGVAAHPHKALAATASYDKAVIIWTK